ncbi:MAG: glycosyltransferase family 39 protein [Anaerolineae bacterium]
MPNEILPHGRWRWFLLIGILALATFLRLYQLDRTPPGFHYDEAFNAMQARDVLRGVNRPIFFTGNFGEEPMQMYVEAVIFALAGQSPYTARLSNVVLGLLLIPALYFCGRALFPRARLAPLVAAFVGATLYWAINFSRLGIETGSLPWVLTLSAGALALACERNDWRWGAAGGFLLGATVYTYLAARVWPFVILFWFICLALLHRDRLRIKTWGVIALTTALTIAPLALFFLLNPVALTGRAGQVLTPDQFGGNLLRTAGMFFFGGDVDPRDNLPGRAALDPFLALLFIAGLAISLRRVKKSAYTLVLIWFVVMTLPSALTEFAPNLRRAIGALPAVALLCGIGVEWLWQTASRRPLRILNFELRIRNSKFAFLALLLLGLAYSAWSSADAYFNQWSHETGLYYSFDAGLQAVASALAVRPAGEQLCLSPAYPDHPTVLWAMDGRPYSTFDGRRVTVLPDSALPTTCAIITYEDQNTNLLRFYPNAQRLTVIDDLANKPYAEIYHIPAGAAPNLQPQHALDARMGNAVRVLGYDLTRQGDRIDLQLYWRPTGPIQEDYTVFVHLLGPVNPDSGSPVWAQDDAQPGHGTYPTSRWQPGQTIIDMYTLKLPPGAPAAHYRIETGMYLLSTGQRLSVSTLDQGVQDRLLFASIDY